MTLIVEEEPKRPAVSLTLLSGFLGAGKTTVLNHIVRADHGVPIGVLVNDFGEINIDSELVANVDGETLTLANGCICCTIRDDMLLTLFRLLHRPRPPRHVIIEASGISDPLAILKGFEQAKLFDLLRIESVVAVVDADHFSTMAFRDQPLALHQLVVADLILLNKMDLIEPAQRPAIVQKLEQSMGNARVLPIAHGKVPIDLIMGFGRFDPEKLLELEIPKVHVHGAQAGEQGGEPGFSFESWSYQTDKVLGLEPLHAALDALPPSVYRAKGIVELREVPGRAVIVQLVGKRVELDYGEPWGDSARCSKLVVIGAAGTLDRAALESSFAACSVDRSSHSAVSGGLRGWIRSLWPRVESP